VVDLREWIARAMFEKDEPGREAVAGIRRMTWEDVGEQYRNNWRERADAALAAIEASGTHVLVPVEPTIEMCDAATRSTSAFMALEQRGADLRRLKHNIRYRAMLAARPRDISRPPL
jgi:hypothetical protein